MTCSSLVGITSIIEDDVAGSCTVDVALISCDVLAAVELVTNLVVVLAVVVAFVLVEIGVFTGRLVVGCRVDFICWVDMTFKKVRKQLIVYYLKYFHGSLRPWYKELYTL